MRPLLLAIALFCCVAESRSADSIRCGSRIISVEARAADILAACGQPDYRDVFSYPGPGSANEIADSEQWTYNFGSNQLLRVLKLRFGRLIDIEADGYGFPKTRPDRCSPSSIVDGLSKYRLVASCGQPFTRRTVGFVNAIRPSHQRRYGGLSTSRGHYAVEVFREEWVYNFGSRYLLKVVSLEDGTVAGVQNGDRGFNSR